MGPDLVIRRATIKYFNSGEDSPHLTDRSVRSLVKLFSVDEGGWQEDMEHVRKLCEATGLELASQPTELAKTQRNPTGLSCKSCCCAPHEMLCSHCSHPARLQTHTTHTWDSYPLVDQEGHTNPLQEEQDHFLDVAGSPAMVYDTGDNFTSTMLSLRLGQGMC